MQMIPALDQFCFRNDYGISAEFGKMFVSLHRKAADTDDTPAWKEGRRHWVQILEEVLDSDAVPQDASGKAAIRRAVVTAVRVINEIVTAGGGCPICPASEASLIAEGRKE